MKQLLTQENIYIALSIVVGVYEVIARLAPTVKNYSILSKVVGIINFLLPNFKKGDSKESKHKN